MEQWQVGFSRWGKWLRCARRHVCEGGLEVARRLFLDAVCFRRCWKYRNTINAPWHIILERVFCWRGEARSHQRSFSGHGKGLEALVEAVDDVLAMARVESTDASHARY